MATITRQELVERALANLGVLSAGQTPSAEEYDIVDGQVEGVFGELSAKGVITITDYDAIPQELQSILSSLLANDAGPKFGVPSDEKMQIVLENQIRIIVRGRPTGEVLQTEYF